MPGYKLIVVNTVFYYSQNSYTKNLTTDIGDQLQFIKDQLDQSKKIQEPVLIVGHVPPGFTELDFSSDFHNAQMNANYLKVFEGYDDVIKGHFYGHLHFDSVRMSKDNGVMFLAPSLSPWYNFWVPDLSSPNNLGMARLFHYDSQHGSLLSYKQYWANLTLANEKKKLEWVLEYDTQQAPYFLPDLSLNSYKGLIKKMETDSSLFNFFYRSTLVQYPTKTCGKECQRRYLCVVKNVYSEDLQLCQQINEDAGVSESASPQSRSREFL